MLPLDLSMTAMSDHQLQTSAGQHTRSQLRIKLGARPQLARGKPQLRLVFATPPLLLTVTLLSTGGVPWIAGYSKHFVEDALSRHTTRPSIVLDPFAGVGTTLVEADLAGHEAVGFEINPYARFASQTKLKATRVDCSLLRDAIIDFRNYARMADANGVEPHSAPPPGFRTRTPFYSMRVLRKVLLVLDFIKILTNNYVKKLFWLAFSSTMVHYSNYSYEPSLGRKATAVGVTCWTSPVFDALADKLSLMVDDADWYRTARRPGRRRDGAGLRKFFLPWLPKIAQRQRRSACNFPSVSEQLSL